MDTREKNFEADRVIVETIFDKANQEEKKLKKQAKNSDVNMFTLNIFPKIFENIAMISFTDFETSSTPHGHVSLNKNRIKAYMS